HHVLALAPDGLTLAWAAPDGSLKLWDVKSGQERAALQTPRQGLASLIPRPSQATTAALAFSPDGKVLAVGTADGQVKLGDVVARRERKRGRAHAGGVRAVRFAADGRPLLSLSGQEPPKLWDLAAGGNKPTVLGRAAGPAAVSFAPDGGTVAVGSPDGPVRL